MATETIPTNHPTNLRTPGPTTLSSIAFSIAGSVALVGNFFVVYLFKRRPQWLSKSHNRCILNLAITDILTAFSLFLIPKFIFSNGFYQVQSQNYLARELYCRIIWSHFIPFSLGVTSLYTCLVLSLERWLAVTKSLFYKNRFKPKHMNALIMASWVAGLATEFPITLGAGGVYDDPPVICHWTIKDNAKSKGVMLVLFLGQSLVPFFLIFAAYLDIFRTIKVSIRFEASAGTVNFNSLKRLKKVTQMTAIASFVLASCWLPSQLYFMVTTYSNIPTGFEHNVSMLNVLVFCNSCLNPFVYVFSNSAYRKAFKEIFNGFSIFKRGSRDAS